MGTWLVEGPQKLALEDPTTQLDVWLAHAKLHVVGTAGPARVEVRKVGRKGLTVTLEDGHLSVRHNPVRRWWIFNALWGPRSGYFADVIIAVPPEVVSSLTVVSGDVVVSSLHAGATVDVTSGSIAVMGLGTTVRAKTVSGSIEAVGLAGDVALETVSGEISLAGSSADRVQARTISGAVTCDLDNPYAQDIHLDTVSGSITVRVPADADLTVDLGATAGSVTSVFPEVPAVRSPGANSARGRIGAGHGRLKAYAVSGRVALLAGPAIGTEDEPAPGGEGQPGVGSE